jgi:4-hydroxyphenylpyruvate dioxygenase
MRKCIATVSISGTLEAKLDAIGAARFDAIEVFENDLINFPGTPADLRRMCDDRGLGIDLYQPFRDLDAASDDQLRRNLDRAERKFDVMQTLGAPMILVCSNVSAGAVTDDARIAAQLHALADTFEQTRISPGAGTSTGTSTHGRS